MHQSWIVGGILAAIYAIGMAGIGWYSFTSILRRRMDTMTRPLAIVNGIPLEPDRQMRRPAEFGPLLRPWEDIERVRAAIIADQLGARHETRHESAAQRRRRMARMSGATEQDRVLHWLAHWQDYAGSLTGRGWVFQ